MCHDRGFGNLVEKDIFDYSVLDCLHHASYKPLIDTNGRSGTFDEDKAKEITNDLQHCKQLAKDNTTLGSNISFWLMSQKTKHNTKIFIENA